MDRVPVVAVPFYKVTMTDRRNQRSSPSLMEGCTILEREINCPREQDVIDLEEEDVKPIPPLVIQPIVVDDDDEIEFLGFQEARLYKPIIITTEEDSAKKRGDGLNPGSCLTEKSVPSTDEKRKEVVRKKRPSERDRSIKASSSSSKMLPPQASNITVETPSTSRSGLLPPTCSSNSSAQAASASTDSLHPPITSNCQPQTASSGGQNVHTPNVSKESHQEASTYRNSVNSCKESRTSESSTSKRPESASTAKKNPLSDPSNTQPQRGPSDDQAPKARTSQPSKDAPILVIPDSDRGKPDEIILNYKGEGKVYRFSGEGEEMIPKKVPKITKDCQTSASLFNGQPVDKPPVDLRAFSVPQNPTASTSRTACPKSPGPPNLSPQRNSDPLYEPRDRDRNRCPQRKNNSVPPSPEPLKRRFENPESLVSNIRYCHICRQSFPSRSAATRHKSKDHNMKHCPVCFLLVSMRGNVWKNHLLQHHDAGGERGRCLFCKTPFKFEGLYQHIGRLHLKPYEESPRNKVHAPSSFRDRPPSTSTFSGNANSMRGPIHDQPAYQQGSSRHAGATATTPATGPVPSTSNVSQPPSHGSLRSAGNSAHPVGYRSRVNFRVPPTPSSSTSTRIVTGESHRQNHHRDHRAHRTHNKDNRYQKHRK